MAIKENPRGGYPNTCSVPGTYWYFFQFDTNAASAADGISPSGTITSGAPASGVHPFTFDAHTKPRVVLASFINMLGASGMFDAKVTAYAPSTGILSISVYEETGDTRAIDSAHTSDNHTFQVALLCSDSDLAD